MNDVEPEDSTLDELVSAVLDGEATPAERARVLADPVAVARLEELRSLRSRLLGTATATPSPDGVDPVVLALEASGASEQDMTATGDRGTADVSAMPRPRVRRERRRGRPLAVVASLAAAAVVVVVGIGVASREGPSDLAGGAATEEPGDDAGAEAAGTAETDALASTSPSAARERTASTPAQGPPTHDAAGGVLSSADVPDLGTARDAAELLDRYRATTTGDEAGSAESFADDSASSAEVDGADVDRTETGRAQDRTTARSTCAAAALATGTIADRTVIVVRSGGELVVLDALACTPVRG